MKLNKKLYKDMFDGLFNNSYSSKYPKEYYLVLLQFFTTDDWDMIDRNTVLVGDIFDDYRLEEALKHDNCVGDWDSPNLYRDDDGTKRVEWTIMSDEYICNIELCIKDFELIELSYSEEEQQQMEDDE
jgi:hypothetical protein